MADMNTWNDIPVYALNLRTKERTLLEGVTLFIPEIMEQAIASVREREAAFEATQKIRSTPPAKKQKPIVPQHQPSPTKITHSSIYLIRIGTSDHIKIGISVDVHARLRTLQTSTPYPLSLIEHFVVTNAYDVEQSLHNQYADKRLSGEWFALSRTDIDAIKNMLQKIRVTHEGAPYAHP